MIRSLHYLNFNEFFLHNNTNFSSNPNQPHFSRIDLIDTIVISHSIDKQNLQNKNIYNSHSSTIYILILFDNSNIM